jgi:hypothetical protein
MFIKQLELKTQPFSIFLDSQHPSTSLKLYNIKTFLIVTFNNNFLKIQNENNINRCLPFRRICKAGLFHHRPVVEDVHQYDVHHSHALPSPPVRVCLASYLQTEPLRLVSKPREKIIKKLKC